MHKVYFDRRYKHYLKLHMPPFKLRLDSTTFQFLVNLNNINNFAWSTFFILIAHISEISSSQNTSLVKDPATFLIEYGTLYTAPSSATAQTKTVLIPVAQWVVPACNKPKSSHPCPTAYVDFLVIDHQSGMPGEQFKHDYLIITL